ncbi:hypothetical protein [Pseudarthrobacter sp. MDT3-1]
MEQIDELSDEDTGAFAFVTASGSIYRISLDDRCLMRLPSDQEANEAYKNVAATALRLDSENIPLVKIGRLKVGYRGMLLLDIVGDGATVTVRDTSEIVVIRRLQDV